MDESVNGTVIGKIVVSGALYYQGRRQGMNFYADTEAQLIELGQRKKAEIKEQLGADTFSSVFPDDAWEVRIFEGNTVQVLCPYCSRPAKLTTGSAVYPGRFDLEGRKFWACWPCEAWVGCHAPDDGDGKGRGDGTVPLGTLANHELRAARSQLHTLLDPLWLNVRNRRAARVEVYKELADRMKIPRKDCHIAYFDLDRCAQAMVQILHMLYERTESQACPSAPTSSPTTSATRASSRFTVTAR